MNNQEAIDEIIKLVKKDMEIAILMMLVNKMPPESIHIIFKEMILKDTLNDLITTYLNKPTGILIGRLNHLGTQIFYTKTNMKREIPYEKS